MTDLKQAAQQALEALQYGKPNKAITILREALEQPEQEPSQWRDMVVVTLVREGVNKHRARELADHFAAQPEQEPVAYLCENGVGHRYFRWKKPSDIYKPIALYTTPPAAQNSWQGLDEDDIRGLYGKDLKYRDGDYMRYAKTIESKLKERNK